MNHLSTINRADQTVCTLDASEVYIPTESDWAEVAAWDAARGEHHTTDPTPLDLLIEPADDDDAEPWWASLPTDPELDTPLALGPEAEPVSIRTRGPRFTIEVNGLPEDPAGGYAIRDTATGLIVRKTRWFTDAEALASELELHNPRSRASRFSPERDAAGLA